MNPIIKDVDFRREIKSAPRSCYFFFGEEDFEFSIRMKKANVYMACVLDSLIYHKVGATMGKTQGVSKYYMHFF